MSELEEISMEKKGFNLIKKFNINDSFILGIYKGKITPLDIIIKYRQKKSNDHWSIIRTPKHVHWVVDILMKMQGDKELVKSFLDYILEIWEKTKGISTEEEQKNLSIEFTQEELKKYEKLTEKGEYSLKFLIALARLLMIQEKTNNPEAYMFKKVLLKLKKDEHLFSTLSAASFGGRKKLRG